MKSVLHSPRLLSMLIAGVCALGSAPHAFATPPDGGFARGRVIVEARPGLSDADLDNILKEHGGKKHKIGQSRLHVVELPPGLSEQDVVAKLSRRPELKFAELDRLVKPAMAVNDP